MTRPLLVVSAAFGAGTLLGAELSRAVALLLLGLSAVLLGLCLLRPQARLASAGLLGAALALGSADAAAEHEEQDRRPLLAWLARGPSADTPVLVRGRLERSEADEERWRLTVRVETLEESGRRRSLPGRARIEIGGAAARPGLAEGDRIALWTTLQSPDGFHDPGVFDRADQARREGLDAVGYVKSPLLVRVEARARVASAADLAVAARRWCRHALERSVLPGPEQGVVMAMVLGDRTGVDRATAEDFRAAGTYHVLALSGAQVALLAGVLLVLLRPLRLRPVLSALIVSTSLAFYAAFVGADVPIVRAAVMGIVLVVGRSLDLDSDMANLLGLAAGLLLAHRPSSLFDVAFQLSFGATLGLVLLTARIGRGWPVLPLRAELAIAGSIAAQLALLPLLVIHFHRLAPAALVLNLVAVPLSGAVMLLGMATAAAASLSSALGRFVGDLAWLFAHALLWSGRVMRWMPALDIRLPTPPLWAVGLHLAGLCGLARGAAVRRAWLFTVLGLGGIVWGGAIAADGRLELTVLDVGQGDCLVLRSPRGRIWLVDAGGAYGSRFDVGEAVVGPYLWSQGVRRIDRLLLTHAHPDHVGGVPFLLRSFPAREVWEGVAPRRDAGYEALAEALVAWRGHRRSLSRGVSADWDGVSVEVVGPRGGPPPWRTRNDDSVAVLLRWGEVRLLLTGDLEAAGEQALGALRAEVLKVPHHGSRSSSTARFVSGVSPRVAVVSVGAGNRFGHPSPEVVRRYEAGGVRLFRTDRDGAVTVSTDGHALWVRTYLSGHEERLR